MTGHLEVTFDWQILGDNLSVRLGETGELCPVGDLSRNGVGHLLWKGMRLVHMRHVSSSRNAGKISRGAGLGAKKELSPLSCGTQDTGGWGGSL